MDITVLTAVEAWRAYNRGKRQNIDESDLEVRKNRVERLVSKLNDEQRKDFDQYVAEGTP